MLKNFTWDIPVSATGAQATPSMRITIRPKDYGNAKSAGKYLFSINKAAAADLGMADKSYKAAFSFDKEGELIFAINVPDTIPNYKLRVLGESGYQISNKRLAEKILLHLGHNRLKGDDKGTLVMQLHFREEKPESDVRIFNLVRQK